MRPRPRLRPQLVSSTSPAQHPPLPSSQQASKIHACTASTVTAPPTASPSLSEPYLDFLYPSFGFFSRALPSSTRRPSASQGSPSRQPIASTSARLLRPRPGVLEVQWGAAGGSLSAGRCLCGRTPDFCLRCRRASTSTRFAVAPPPPASAPPSSPTTISLSSTPQGLAPAEQSPEPRPPRPPRPKDSAVGRFVNTLDEFDKLLPSTRKTTGIHVNAVPELWSVAKAKKALNRLMGAVSNGLGDGRRHLSSRDKLRLLQLMARAGRAPQPVAITTPPASITGLPIAPATASSSSILDHLATPSDAFDPELAAFRASAAGRIQQMRAQFNKDDPLWLDSPEASVENRSSEALIHLEALDLAGNLPRIPSPGDRLDQHGRMLPILHALFTVPPQSTSTTLVISNQYTALAILFQALRRTFHGAGEAANMINSWKLQHLVETAHIRSNPFADVVRRAYGVLLAKLEPSPAAWFEAQQVEKGAGLGHHLVRVLAVSGSPLQALEVWDVLLDRARNVSLEVETLINLLEGLCRVDAVDDTSRIAHVLEFLLFPAKGSAAATSTPDERHRAQRALLKAAAVSGETGDMARLLKRSDQEGWKLGLEGVSRRMRAASQSGEATAGEIRAIFEEASVVEGPAQDQAKLWGELVRSYVRVNALDEADVSLLEMMKQGLRPPLPLVNSIIAGYAARVADEEAYEMFHRLEYYGLRPNVVTYNALAALHGNARDPEGVERVINDMTAARVQPDVVTYTTLMNAYLAVGRWSDTLDLYNALREHKDPSLRPDAAAVNMVLKASVLAGAPATATLSIFRTALENGLRPNSHSYSHVMHALCTSGLMDLAEELFAMMDGEQEGLPPGASASARPDVHVFSMLAYGYLQANDTAKARACLREMELRGIRATSVTYGIIVASFLRLNDTQGLNMALALAKDFLADSPLKKNLSHLPANRDRLLLRGDDLLAIFVPIVNSFAKRSNPALAVEYFREVLGQRVNPSISLCTALMDAYRRVGDLSGIQHVWDHLHSFVINTYHARSSISEGNLSVDSSHSNALCRPFSIYLDAMIASGNYAGVLKSWQLHASEGFTFDAANWNALGAAASRSGNLDLAFWIAEYVLGSSRELSERLVPPPPSLHLHTVTPADSPMETRSRLYQHRQAERDRQQKFPTTVVGALSDAAGAIPIDIGETLKQASETRRGHLWFPHASLLQALASGLRSSNLSAGQRERLGRQHPRTMAALRRRREGVKIKPRGWGSREKAVPVAAVAV